MEKKKSIKRNLLGLESKRLKSLSPAKAKERYYFSSRDGFYVPLKVVLYSGQNHNIMIN